MELLTHLLDDQVPSELHLALGSIEEDHSRKVLTHEEQTEFSVFTNTRRRQEFVSTRVLVKKLGSHAGLDPRSIHTRKDNLGKPFALYNNEHLYVSIAHTEEKVLCALSKQMDMGIDIEPAGRSVDERLRRRILNSREQEDLGHVQSIRLWTMKEAAVKLLGCGLRVNLNELTISHDDKIGFLARFNDEKIIRICSFQHQGYWISIAYFF